LEKEEIKLIRAYISQKLHSQIDFLKVQITGVKFDDDIEFVHHTRVSSRRIRNILQVFSAEIGKKSAKKWGNNLRCLTKSLTNVRDLDVQLSFLENDFSSKIDQKYLQGIRRVVLRKQQTREKIQSRILKDIEVFYATKTFEGMDKFIKQYTLPNEEILLPLSLYQIAEKTIDQLIKKVFVYVPFITDPNNIDDLHQMRIAVKNLRYTSEIFIDIHPDISEELNRLKTIQDYLGKIHDCDVWKTDLDQFEVKEQNRILKFYGKNHPYHLIQPGIKFLSEEIQKTRTNTYTEFINTWTTIYQDLFWSKFREIFSRYNHNQGTAAQNPGS